MKTERQGKNELIEQNAMVRSHSIKNIETHLFLSSVIFKGNEEIWASLKEMYEIPMCEVLWSFMEGWEGKLTSVSTGLDYVWLNKRATKLRCLDHLECIKNAPKSVLNTSAAETGNKSERWHFPQLARYIAAADNLLDTLYLKEILCDFFCVLMHSPFRLSQESWA